MGGELLAFGDWQTMGDEDCQVWIRCPYCYQQNMDTLWDLVPGIFPTIQDVVDAANNHTHREL